MNCWFDQCSRMFWRKEGCIESNYNNNSNKFGNSFRNGNQQPAIINPKSETNEIQLHYRQWSLIEFSLLICWINWLAGCGSGPFRNSANLIWLINLMNSICLISLIQFGLITGNQSNFINWRQIENSLIDLSQISLKPN